MFKIKGVLLGMVMAILLVPAVQFLYAVFPEISLNGFTREEPMPRLRYFTWERWFAGEFQEKFGAGLNDNAGFRNTMIRVRNQYDWSFFGFTHAPGFLAGKEGYLFEEDYIHEYTGRFFIGERTIGSKLDRLRIVRDSLAAYGTTLLFVLEPGKASFFPEYIPDSFGPQNRRITNYEIFARLAAEKGITTLDLNRWFMQMKDTTRYPLFPKYGMHWSLYGAKLAADTLARFVEKVTGRPLPVFKTQYLHFSNRSQGTDYDIGDMLNLLFPLPSTPNVYPMVAFDSIPDGSLPALVVADSYYINLVDTYGRKIFGPHDYWYYNYSIYPHQNEQPPLLADKTALREKLLRCKVVLVMVSEINLHCCLWNFADEAWLAFTPGARWSHLDRLENSIRIDREWFRFMVHKSESRNRDLDRVIRDDAEYTFQSNFNALENKTFWDSVELIRMGISGNPEWMANVKAKAAERHISADSMMLLDAIHTYRQSEKKP